MGLPHGGLGYREVDQFRVTWSRKLVLRPDDLRSRKNSGCGSNTFLDLDLLVNRGIGWVGWKYHSGWVEWEFDWHAFGALVRSRELQGQPAGASTTVRAS